MAFINHMRVKGIRVMKDVTLTMKGLGRRLRDFYATDEKPLSWALIDRLEQLAETEEKVVKGPRHHSSHQVKDTDLK